MTDLVLITRGIDNWFENVFMFQEQECKWVCSIAPFFILPLSLEHSIPFPMGWVPPPLPLSCPCHFQPQSTTSTPGCWTSVYHSSIIHWPFLFLVEPTPVSCLLSANCWYFPRLMIHNRIKTSAWGSARSIFLRVNRSINKIFKPTVLFNRSLLQKICIYFFTDIVYVHSFAVKLLKSY